MKVLLSAYACEPGKGSEPEVGFQTMLAAAEQHSVWVLTRKNNVDSLSEFLSGHPLHSRITIVGFDLGDRVLKLKKLTRRIGTVWYYDRWQAAIEEVATELDREHDFDVVHHVTLAAYWGRLGVSCLEKPVVVGPVGGAANSPVTLLPVLGFLGMLGEMSRRIIRPIIASITGARNAQTRAAAIIAQNHEAARAIGAPRRTVVMPNGLIGATAANGTSPPSSREERFLFAGRLVGWKGAILAIRALGYYPSSTATLDIYGSGSQKRRLQREAKRLQLTDRVTFHGAVLRSTLLRRLSTSSALIHPALHEDAGLIVAEALGLGTPVVCLDRAGPPVIASYWPPSLSRPVRPSTPSRTAMRLAQALTELDGAAKPPDGSPAQRFIDEILAIYERVAAGKAPECR